MALGIHEANANFKVTNLRISDSPAIILSVLADWLSNVTSHVGCYFPSVSTAISTQIRRLGLLSMYLDGDLLYDCGARFSFPSLSHRYNFGLMEGSILIHAADPETRQGDRLVTSGSAKCHACTLGIAYFAPIERATLFRVVNENGNAIEPGGEVAISLTIT